MIVLWLPADTTEARERELLEQAIGALPKVDAGDMPVPHVFEWTEVVVWRSVWVTSPVWSWEG